MQELVGPPRADLRIVVAGGEPAGAIRRIASRGEWRTNASLGASREPAVPDADASALASAAARAVGADLVGVDLLPSPTGRYVVLELNGAVDFDDAYSFAGRDVFLDAARGLGLRRPARAAGVRATVSAH